MTRWAYLDVESTGLLDSDGVPRKSKLLEVGVVVVDIPTFEVVAECNWLYHFELKPTLTRDHHFKWAGGSEEIFIHKDVVKMHQESGLWKATAMSQLRDYQKMDELIQRFLVEQGCQGSPLCGSGVSFDRAFLRSTLPGVHELFHYRDFDVNAFFLLKSAITGQDCKREKPARHRAIDDCKASIAVVEQHVSFMEEFLKEALHAEV